MPPEFPYPVCLLLFNRPDDARETLDSLRAQTLGVPDCRLTLSIDGYRGSRDEFLGKPDRTAEMAQLAETVFPDARILRRAENLGIADHYADVEHQVFDDESATWALFFEEDLVLSPVYLENMVRLLDYVAPEERIVVASATGDTLSPKEHGDHALYAMDHAWGFALRRSHYVDRRPLVDAYLATMSGSSYFRRDNAAIMDLFVEEGMYPVGTSQDYVKQAIRRDRGLLAVTTGLNFGRYIGAEGEHFDPETFERLGYGSPAPVSMAPLAFAEPVGEAAERVDREDRRQWAGELDAVWTSRLHEAVAAAESQAADAAAWAEAADARSEAVAAWAVAADARSEAAETRLEQCEAERSELESRLGAVEASLADAVARLEEVRASRSWKLTAPIRALRGTRPADQDGRGRKS